MEQMKISEVEKAIKGRRSSLLDSKEVIFGISTDSRKIREGDIFFAIKGEKFDGHSFVFDALAKGATCAVVCKSWKWDKDSLRVIEIADTKRALGELASVYRRKFQIPVVAVTGTNGKTTTKEMIYSVLQRKFHVKKSEGNYNNDIGVPLSIFTIERGDEVFVVEMGMNHIGEIRRLCEIAQPTIGVITNVGEAHLEFLGNIENIAKAKMELVESLPRDGWTVLNGDDTLLMGKRKDINSRILTFGLGEECDVRPDRIKLRSDGGYNIFLDGEEVSIPLIGIHNVYNALAAVAIGKIFEVDWNDIREALEKIEAIPLRMERISLGGVLFINDSYNANPTSMEQAITCLSSSNGRRIAVLGDMLELGELSFEFHKKIGKRIAQSGIDILITVGKEAEGYIVGAKEGGMSKDKIYSFEKTKDVVVLLKEILKGGETVLVKGSRKMRMEEIFKDKFF